MTDLSGSRRRSRLTRLLRATAERVQPPPNQDDLTADPVGAVVVGCHGRPGSDGALRFAAAQARQRGVALFVVIAFAEPIDPDTDEFDTPAAVRRQQARTMAQQALARAVPDPPPHQVVAIAGLP